MTLIRFLIFATPFVVGFSIARGDDDLRLLQRQYTETIQPLLHAACHDCHTGDSAEAGFNLDSYQSLDQILNARKKWLKVEHRAAAKEMPPAEATPLADADLQLLMSWLDEVLHLADCNNIDPGRVTLRRLNRTEYQNTIRDLLDVNYEPAADFPGDDVGYGFDNIADVISLPPILMEKYLNAAEEVSVRAIVDPDRPSFSQTLRFDQLDLADGTGLEENSVGMYTNSTIGKQIKLPAKGTYRLCVRAYGTPGGAGPIKLSAGFDNSKPVSGNLTATRADKASDEEFIVRGKAGDCRLEISFLNDAYVAKTANEPGFDRNLFIQQIQIQGPLDQRPQSHRRLIADSVPEDSAAQRQFARQILNKLASRAFRRRATTEELDQLLGFFESAQSEGDNFEVALRYSVQAILVSPHFLYKVETPTTAGETRMLNDFELATSLSYFLWSTMPDDELFRLATEGELRNATILRMQLDRMLADPKSSAVTDNFVAQWLQLRHLENFQPDPDLFPGVDRVLRDDMITETKLVFAELIQRDAKVTELLHTDFTFVNQRLAEFYGIANIKGEEFRRVSTKKTGRIGLMTHASILTLTSNPNRTSPVKRGKWVMENLLGEEPPPPDPKAMKLEDQAELTGTVRQRMEQHRADPNCAVCHQVMDELGFALENYDAVGRWRETDDGNSIDPTGLLPDGSQFSGASEMQQTIHQKMHDKFVRCMIEKMLIYSTGRGLEYFDECAIDKIMEGLSRKDDRFKELIYLVITSDPFLKRRGEAE